MNLGKERFQGCLVSIRNNNGSIRLSFSFKGKEIRFNLGLPYLENNFEIAIAKAWEVHNDIIFNRYDGNNDKYKIGFISANKIVQKQELTIKEAWEFYKNIKSDTAKISQINKWRAIDKALLIFDKLLISEIDKLVTYLLTKYAKSTVKAFLVLVSSSIQLTIDYGKYDGKNLLPKIIESLNIKKQKTIKSFSDSEVIAILNAFKNDTYVNPKSGFKHSFYYAFVAFRFLTGCRPSEAIALTWDDYIKNNDKLWIRFDKRYSGNQLISGTKNGVKCRLFPVNAELSELLENIERKPETKLIFPSFNDGYIDRENFGRRIWKPILENLVREGLVKEYLPFYDIRHTFATKLCRSGKVDLKTISSILGNSVETLIENYLAVDESLELPNLFRYDQPLMGVTRSLNIDGT